MYTTFIVQPLYNVLIGIMVALPWVDIGIAVIIFTIVVKLALYHLSKVSILTQIKMKEIEPESNKIKQQYANDRQAQALKMMELYKARGVKPFSGFLLIIIQFPILLGLLSVFYRIVPKINMDLVYPFLQDAASHVAINTHFLWFIDLTEKSLILAVLAGLAQYIQMQYSPAFKQLPTAKQTSHQPSGQALDIANSMTKQMKYMLPVLAFVSTYWLIPAQFPQAASIIALYWAVTAVFTLGQELLVRRNYSKRQNGTN